LNAIIGLLLLAVYIAVVVGLAALITWAVIKIFPTERKPKKPDEPDSPPSNGSSQTGGRLFRSAKRQTG
jgi:hypothetical protein